MRIQFALLITLPFRPLEWSNIRHEPLPKVHSKTVVNTPRSRELTIEADTQSISNSALARKNVEYLEAE
jgi:hypothetical protein